MMNPTVTLAAVLWGRVGRARGAAMVLSQLAGATVGGAALQAVRPAGARALCVTAPAAGLSPGRAAALEAVLGACLALANCAAWDVRNTGLRDSWPLRIGTSVAGMSLAAGLLTGASINPVRSFAPALWSGVWDHHWVSRFRLLPTDGRYRMNGYIRSPSRRRRCQTEFDRIVR